MRFPLVTSFVTILALGAPGLSGADNNVRIKEGAIQIVGIGFGGTTAISGTGGLALTFSFDSGGTEARCVPCLPGETISLTSSVLSGDGMATYRGQTYEISQASSNGALIFLQGPSFTLPVSSGTEPTTVEFETPFTVLDGSVVFLRDANGELQHNLRLTGSGTATVRFIVSHDEFLQTFYSFESLRFDFSKKQKSNE